MNSNVLKVTFVFPFFNSSIRVESLCVAVMFAETFVVTATTDGARGGTKCAAVLDSAGEAAGRMDDNGGGAGVANPARETRSVVS